MAPDPVPLLSGVNHIAVLTEDLDRFVTFYTEVFDLQVAFTEDTPAFRHAILRTGPNSWLHPVHVDGNTHGTAIAAMFDRGHLDHLALTAASPEAFATIRARLRDRGLHDDTVDDLGAFHSVWFGDPDGMPVEVVLVVDPELRGIHEPRWLAAAGTPAAAPAGPASAHATVARAGGRRPEPTR